MDFPITLRLNRRELLKWGGAALAGGVVDLRAARAFGQDHVVGATCGDTEHPECHEVSQCRDEELVEFYPTSPFILNPFTDEIFPPSPLSTTPLSHFMPAPGRGAGQQASDYCERSTHQIWTDAVTDPMQGRLYYIKLRVGPHSFTSSKVQPIDAHGLPVVPPDNIPGPRYLPDSTIWGFNGAFPGPMINAEYGKPVLIRFENQLHLDNGFDSDDFGAPCRQFLTHLHNAHTAPESDGNPNFRFKGYFPQEWVDNLYLNRPPDDDDREKQSFLWFHDHYEGYTGAHVYKGLVGLYPIYDPRRDPGDERSRAPEALRLPGVRTDYPDGTFKVDYDIPLVIFDCRLNDGTTPAKDFHKGCGEANQKSWGKTFFRHYPNHGFVGDIFTVNGKAFPVLRVKRRKYRFRLLDASVARAYELKLMTGGQPEAARGTQGQWLLPDGEQCMRFTQIASEGGLLPFPIRRNSLTLWPAKRREVVVDFSRYMDGSPTADKEEIYLVNIMSMDDGRKPDSSDPDYKVPILKFVIDGNEMAQDDSVVPSQLRPLPLMRPVTKYRTFELERGGVSGSVRDEFPLSFREMVEEFEWLINGRPFNPEKELAYPTRGEPEIWTIKSGGGWGHPMHFHQEEHQVLRRNGRAIPREGPITDERLADDVGKEDTIALNGSEEVVIYRNFRTFPAPGFHEPAPYVAHCHNLAHEDHSMMFGWAIVEP